MPRWPVKSGAVALLAFMTVSGDPARAFCFDEAAERYGVPAELLRTIAEVESSMNPRAININQNGTRDIGLMQINTWWLPKLEPFGIREEHLWDACTSVQVGAWVLAHNFKDLGYTWEAIGAYNAKHPEKRLAYARRVYRVLDHQRLRNQ